MKTEKISKLITIIATIVVAISLMILGMRIYRMNDKVKMMIEDKQRTEIIKQQSQELQERNLIDSIN